MNTLKRKYDPTLQRFSLAKPFGTPDISYSNKHELVVEYQVEHAGALLTIRVGFVPGRGGQVNWVRLFTGKAYCTWINHQETRGWVERAHVGACQALHEALFSGSERLGFKLWRWFNRGTRIRAVQLAA